MTLDESLVKRQISLEEEAVTLGINQYRESLAKAKNEADMPPGMALLKKSLEPFIAAIKMFLLPSRAASNYLDLRRFISQVPTEDVAYIAARRIFESLTKDEPIQRVSISITNMIQDHKELLKYKNHEDVKIRGHYKVVEDNLKSADVRYKRTVMLYAKRKVGIADEVLTDVTKVNVGKKLIELFIQSTGLVELVQEESSNPAKSGKYIVQPTASTLDWLEKHHAKCELMYPFYLPMVSLPRPWTTVDDGGFYSLPLRLVKTRNKQALESLRNHSMPLVYNAINALQATPWRINKKVYEVIKELWEARSTLGDLPRQTEIELPIKPWNSDEEFNYMKQNQPEVVKKWKREASKVYEKNMADKSNRISMAYKLIVANKMINEEKFYYCWVLDWRGRVYPVQSHVNPQSNDVGKALLEFAEGKPLGERGLYWLKIQLANTYGIDKLSFEDRIKWVEEHEELILDSARNPLDGSRFWAETDEAPFSFLAACFEYLGYKEEGLGYVSHLPIALDATCSGIQNFSAMLRDSIGGKATNLIPQDKPNDIYARVADVLIKKIEIDSKDTKTLFPPKPKKKTNKEEEIKEVPYYPLSYVADLWKGKINRKVCKRATMTFCYGAKQFGMKDQLKVELPKISEKMFADTEEFNLAVRYLGNKLYEAISEVVVAAKDAMDWLQEAAKIVSKGDKAIQWTTPVGFRPFQEYLEAKSIRINTIFGSTRLSVSIAQDIPNKINKRKQMNGIAPNFVHSMDASLLMLTVNRCSNKGVANLAMIHDSFGTHACDTDTLNVELREAFIQQYSNQDVLENFRKELSESVGEELPAVPKKGDLDLTLVRDSRYFFA